jgi:predicted O-methyltransferase YrrM
METRDSLIAFGRREGWYLFVRALKPQLVVETGVHHGVGAIVIASALIRNRQDGFTGYYVGTEIDKNGGFLFRDEYASVGEIKYGDSVSTLKDLKTKIDIFINDSDHSYEYEEREYATIKTQLKESSLILGDNSHVTNALREFAEQNKRPFLFFKEIPDAHWYPGAGIGISPTRIPLK